METAHSCNCHELFFYEIFANYLLTIYDYFRIKFI